MLATTTPVVVRSLMTFLTEKTMDWWAKTLWLPIPQPDGSRRLTELTRQASASYWHLIEQGHYTDGELADYADWYAESRGVPYVIAFSIMVQQVPPHPVLFELPGWGKRQLKRR